MTYLIACEMLRDELELAMETTGISYPTIWMEKGLHDTPQKLRDALQAQLDALPADCDLVLFAMAYCGGAMDGLMSKTARLAAPRFDDCIRLLLSLEPGLHNGADARSLYFTRQWLTSDRYFFRDYESYIVRYGEKKAKKIIKLMLAHYEGYRMVDSGAYDVAAYEAEASEHAALLGLNYSVQPGSIRVLEKLLRQELDEEFCQAAPGEALTQRQFLVY